MSKFDLWKRASLESLEHAHVAVAAVKASTNLILQGAADSVAERNVRRIQAREETLWRLCDFLANGIEISENDTGEEE